MKNIKLERLPSGSYRIRKMINGKSIQIVFDHKPSQAELLKALSMQADIVPVKGSFYSCGKSYIESRTNELSPSSLHCYNRMLELLPHDFKSIKVSVISQMDVQTFINDFTKNHAPKTVHDYHGFISAVLRQFRPDMVLRTTLPKINPNEGYIPTENDIQMILDASKDDAVYHVPFQLAVMGLRRSETCALTLDDIDAENNLVTINKAMVRDDDSPTGWTIKAPKTPSGNRKIYIPDNLINEIMGNGKVYDGYPNQITKALHRYQDKLGLPRFRLHDARHFFASYAHAQGVPDADIVALGGWKTDYTMKKIYRHEMHQQESAKRIFDKLISE